MQLYLLSMKRVYISMRTLGQILVPAPDHPILTMGIVEWPTAERPVTVINNIYHHLLLEQHGKKESENHFNNFTFI